MVFMIIYTNYNFIVKTNDTFIVKCDLVIADINQKCNLILFWDQDKGDMYKVYFNFF